MWGLHIMDWTERDNIGNIFLKIFSFIALFTAATGIILFLNANENFLITTLLFPFFVLSADPDMHKNHETIRHDKITHIIQSIIRLLLLAQQAICITWVGWFQ